MSARRGGSSLFFPWRATLEGTGTQGTHALASQDPTDGSFIDLFIPAEDGSFSEPADLVIDHAGQEAYVSCMGSDSVFRIDISGSSMMEVERWSAGAVEGSSDFLLKRPRFLHWTGLELFVAPFTSGNNTLTFVSRQVPKVNKGLNLPTSVIQDGYDATDYPDGGLPNHDLVRITPDAPPGRVVVPVLRRAGSLLMAHGSPPGEDEYWMLGVDSLNLSEDSEPELNGNFAQNVLVRKTIPGVLSPVPTVAASETIDLASTVSDPFPSQYRLRPLSVMPPRRDGSSLRGREGGGDGPVKRSTRGDPMSRQAMRMQATV